MKHVFLLIYLSFLCFLVESHGLVSRHKYDNSEYKNHLSEFLQSFNDIYYKTNDKLQLGSLVRLFLKSNLENPEDSGPINFTEDSHSDISFSKSEFGSSKPHDNTIAECTISQDDSRANVSQKFYMPLKDAETFAKNFERNLNRLKSGDRPFKVLNLSNESESDDYSNLQNLRIKCTPVSGNEVKDSCKACFYFEEMVYKRHFRFGHIVDCAVLECMNGYDKKLDNTSNGYYFNDFGKFHPICMT
ncbi:hypothetical protein MACJ_000216 [Theileria orientalis]|uniref:Uncharacterized protein n=1 Tax=Theileria orientalis TaxID=68886 RepID=A0A976M3P5_THEOR|nr:hypothetical protein MACJ_000216 [Theileria orientalis]